MAYVRIYSNNGGIIRFTYPLYYLKERIYMLSQLAGRTATGESGAINENIMLNDDQIIFVDKSIRTALRMLGDVMAKANHPDVTPDTVVQYVYILTASNFGHIKNSQLGVFDGLIEEAVINYVLYQWFGVNRSNELKLHYATDYQTSQKMIKGYLYSFLKRGQGQTSLPAYRSGEKPLDGRYLGDYPTVEAMEQAVPGFRMADIGFSCEHTEYVIYEPNGMDGWNKLSEVKDGIPEEKIIDPTLEDASFPQAVTGDVFLITRGGSFKGYAVEASDLLLCISDNINEDYNEEVTLPPQEDSYKDSLDNFLLISGNALYGIGVPPADAHLYNFMTREYLQGLIGIYPDDEELIVEVPG